MAKLILRDCFISLGGTDLSDHVSSVEIMLKKDDVDVSSFSGGGRTHAQGLAEHAVTVNFQQDFAAVASGANEPVDSYLYTMWSSETTQALEIRPTSAAVSATNPKYTGSCILLEYQPLSGKVGELAETSVELKLTTVITRATA